MNTYNAGYSYGQSEPDRSQPAGHLGSAAQRAKRDPRRATTGAESTVGERTTAQTARALQGPPADACAWRHVANRLWPDVDATPAHAVGWRSERVATAGHLRR